MTTNNNQGDSYKVVKKCDTLQETNIIIALLNSNDIECFTSDTSFANLFPGNPISRNKIEIRVRVEDEQEALDILNAKFSENDLEQ